MVSVVLHRVPRSISTNSRGSFSIYLSGVLVGLGFLKVGIALATFHVAFTVMNSTMRCLYKKFEWARPWTLGTFCLGLSQGVLTSYFSDTRTVAFIWFVGLAFVLGYCYWDRAKAYAKTLEEKTVSKGVGDN